MRATPIIGRAMMRDVGAMSGLILRGVEHAYGALPSLRGV